MEVTTVSPSPAFPTEGHDLCEIDVTSLAIHSVTLLICLSGLAGNGAVLGLLRVNDCNYGIFMLALADFLFLLFTLPSALLFLVEDVSCSPIVSLLYLRFLFQLSLVSYYWALFRLMRRSIVQDMHKLCNLCCRCNIRLNLMSAADGFQFWAFFALFTVIPVVTSLCPSQQQELCRAGVISMYTLILLLFAAPVLISRTIDFIQAKWGSQQQQQPETSDIVVFLIVLFTLLLNLWNFLQQLGYIAVPSQVVLLPTCIHSTIKPFFYFLAGRCWRSCSIESLRLSLWRVFDEQKKKTARRNDGLRDTVV